MDSIEISIGNEKGSLPLNRRGEDNPFSTGSLGYHGNGKLTFKGKRYQVNVIIVEIGSKERR